MTDELRQKLSSEIEEADWNALKVHHEKQAVIVVSDKLDLVSVGIAVANDDTNLVKIWLDNGDIYRPTKEQVDSFESDEYKKMCKFIIVQPFVLIQLLS